MSIEKYVVGVDLGGTKVEACLMDSSRNVLSRHRILSQPQKGLRINLRISNLIILFRGFYGYRKIS